MGFEGSEPSYLVSSMSVSWTSPFYVMSVYVQSSGDRVRETYEDVLPLPHPSPLCVVSPCHALAARAQVAQACAQQRQAAQHPQDVEDGEAALGLSCLLIDSGFQLLFGLAGGCGRARNSSFVVVVVVMASGRHRSARNGDCVFVAGFGGAGCGRCGSRLAVAGWSRHVVCNCRLAR